MEKTSPAFNGPEPALPFLLLPDRMLSGVNREGSCTMDAVSLLRMFITTSNRTTPRLLLSVLVS